MYSTLILIKPGSPFSMANMEAVVRAVGETAGRTVECVNSSVILKAPIHA